MVAIKISNLKAHHLSFRLIIFGIVERKIVPFGFINGNFTLFRIHLEVLDSINLRIGKLFREQGFDKVGLVLTIVKSAVKETSSDVPHKMAEWDTRNLLGQASLDLFRFIVGIVHPMMHFGADMVPCSVKYLHWIIELALTFFILRAGRRDTQERRPEGLPSGALVL